MTHWTIAAQPERCGFAWCAIPKGEPMQVVTIAGVRAKRYRCQQHAEGPVDEAAVAAARQRLAEMDAPAASTPPASRPPTYRHQPSRLVPFSELADDLFDPKMAAAHDRD